MIPSLFFFVVFSFFPSFFRCEPLKGHDLHKPNVIGSATEGALVILAAEWGYNATTVKEVGNLLLVYTVVVVQVEYEYVQYYWGRAGGGFSLFVLSSKYPPTALVWFVLFFVFFFFFFYLLRSVVSFFFVCFLSLFLSSTPGGNLYCVF